MVITINGEITGKDKIKNNFTGVINKIGTFISVTNEKRELIHILFNPGPTVKIYSEGAELLLKGEVLEEFSGTLAENNKKEEIEGIVSEHGIFITVFGEGRVPKQVLFNPYETETIEPCWSCAHTEYKK